MNSLKATTSILAILLVTLSAPASAWQNEFDQNLPKELQLNDNGFGDGAFGLGGTASKVSVSTLWSQSAVRPGDKIYLAVQFDIDKDYKINYRSVSEDGLIPTSVKVTESSDSLQPTSARFLEPDEFPYLDKNVKGYRGDKSDTGDTYVFIQVAVSPDAKPGTATLKLEVIAQACDKTTCLADSKYTPTATIDIVAPNTPVETLHADIFELVESASNDLEFKLFNWTLSVNPENTLFILILAAFGGFLLNFTPCVLPMIPIKIIGLSQSAGNRRKCFFLGLIMSIGVIAFWLAIGAAISFITGFNSVSNLFQNPLFTIAIGILIVGMGIGMCGLFAVRLPQWVYKINPKHDSIHGSFLFGIMTAVLATPCTAPFMGTAIGWATQQNSSTIVLSIFAAVGFGMALPYAVLATFPALVDRMPRTGPASELIKQVMGILMFAAGTFFLGAGLSGQLASPPDPPSRLYWWAVTVFVVIAGAWLIVKTIKITPSLPRRTIFSSIGLLIILSGLALGFTFTSSPIKWTYYTPERLATAQESGKVVVLEFTAEWCLNCKALEKSVLHNPKVADLLNSNKVAPIKIDLTGKNEVGNRKLNEEGRRTIPYLVVYAPNGQKVFDSDVYTVNQVVDAIHKASALTTTASSIP